MNKTIGVLMLVVVIMSLSMNIAFAERSANDKIRDINDSVEASEINEKKVAVIIGFKEERITKLDQEFVRGHGEDIKYSYNIIPAIAAKLTEREIETLKKNPNVAYVEIDGKVKALGEKLPWGVDRIDAEIVHACNKGTGVKVAIIDTGIDYTHPDLDGNYKGGYDFVNGDFDPMDDNGHGTHCAGIIAAEDNEIGVIGVAPEAYLYGVKVLNSSGIGYTSDVIAGIDWTVQNGMQVISMSLGANNGSIAYKNACDNAYDAGIVVVAAAGNDGSDGDNSVDYPAKYNSVIAVAATNSSDTRPEWSSKGPEVEFAAPGVDIYSTIPGGYGIYSGTSMACPHVTGLAALVIASTNMSNDGIRWRLQNTSEDLGPFGKDIYYGYGLVDADEAVPTLTPTPTDYVHPWISKGNGSYDVKDFSPWAGYSTAAGRWETGDLNGDEKTDLIHIVGGDYVHPWISKGNGSYDVKEFSPWAGYSTAVGRWETGDLNGDGKTDLIHIVGGDYVHPWISKGDGSYDVKDFSPWAGYSTAVGRWETGDLNGDGKTDLIHIVGGDYVRPWISKGDGNYDVKEFSPWAGYSTEVGRWETGDLNGDGKTDLIHIVGGDYVHPWISKGDGSYDVKEFSPWAGYSTTAGRWETGDLNGDGKTDLIHIV